MAENHEAWEAYLAASAAVREYRCQYCGDMHQIAMLPQLLPMDCPNCGVPALEYDHWHVVCTNCGSVDWRHPDRNRTIVIEAQNFDDGDHPDAGDQDKGQIMWWGYVPSA